MNVAELIEELRKLPPFAPVVIEHRTDDDGYLFSVEAEAARWEGNHVLLTG
jgi:hypothetical protein